ncbi:MAG: hypothetical protein E6I98_05555 [Chloroflexi bacterium]|nr:MAG: hypothetical protein E6I98_05555 [Chloroflexota bacterium]
MAFERRRARLGDLAFWLAVASSTLVGLTLLVSEIGSLLGAPPQQAWFSLMVGTGIALAVVCAFAGVVTAHVSRSQEGASRRARSALVVGYCILGSLAAMAVLATVTLIAVAHD